MSASGPAAARGRAGRYRPAGRAGGAPRSSGRARAPARRASAPWRWSGCRAPDAPGHGAWWPRPAPGPRYAAGRAGRAPRAGWRRRCSTGTSAAQPPRSRPRQRSFSARTEPCSVSSLASTAPAASCSFSSASARISHRVAQRPGGAQGWPWGGSTFSMRLRRSAASHAGQQPRIAQPPPLEARGVPAFLGGQADAPQQAVGERTRLGDLQRLPELVARGDQIGGRGHVRCGPSTRSR